MIVARGARVLGIEMSADGAMEVARRAARHAARGRDGCCAGCATSPPSATTP